MGTVVLPWVLPFSAASASPEQCDAAEYDADPIVRYDLADAVDAEHYPDGVYWRFENPRLAGKRFTVRGARVVEVVDVYEQEGVHWRASRRLT